MEIINEIKLEKRTAKNVGTMKLGKRENLEKIQSLPTSTTVYEEQLETKFSRETENVFILSLAQLLL